MERWQLKEKEERRMLVLLDWGQAHFIGRVIFLQMCWVLEIICKTILYAMWISWRSSG